MSQSPQAGQFNSYSGKKEIASISFLSLNPLKRVNSILTMNHEEMKQIAKDIVSIPSSGSIQFLQTGGVYCVYISFKSQSPQAGQFNSYTPFIALGVSDNMSLNPLKRVNSILTDLYVIVINWKAESQSPQAGQFNSYCLVVETETINYEQSQSPQAGQFNSYSGVFK